MGFNSVFKGLMANEFERIWEEGIRFQSEVLCWNLSVNMENPTTSFENSIAKTPKTRTSKFFYFSNRCTVHFDISKVHKPANALYIKLDKALKFALKSL